MRAFLSAVLIGAGVLLACTTSGLLVRIWILRRSFDMAARSPVLLIVNGMVAAIMTLMILLHWHLLLDEGKGLPCYATFLSTYFWYSAGVIPYVLRAVRIVVIYHSAYRYKYAGLVKWTNLRKAWASNALAIIVLAIILFAISARRISKNYGCAFFEETIALGTVTLLNAPGFLFLLYKLSQVDDVFKLRREFTWVFNVVVSLTNAYMLIQVLYKSGAVTETRTLHLVLEMLMLAIMLNVLFWTVLVSVAMHDGWRGFRTSRVALTESWEMAASMRAPGSMHNDGVLGYVEEGGLVASMFEQFCTRNLCAESWDFIVAACKYEEISDPGEQFEMFVRITEEYLQPTSPQEVNISSKMQTKAALLQDKTKFLSLDGHSRRNVLQEPLKEIVRMLEENLLTKFTQTPEMLKRRKLIEQADSAALEGDENMRHQLLTASNFVSLSRSAVSRSRNVISTSRSEVGDP